MCVGVCANLCVGRCVNMCVCVDMCEDMSVDVRSVDLRSDTTALIDSPHHKRLATVQHLSYPSWYTIIIW